MKFPKVIAYSAPKPLKSYASILGRILAVVLVIITMLQLIGAVVTISNLSSQLDGNNGLAIMVFTLALACQIFAIPFLLRLKISDLARLISGILTVMAPWLWAMVSIWSVGTETFAAQFGVVSSVSSTWWLLIANFIWLAASLFVVKQLGLEITWNEIVRSFKSQLKKKKN